MEGKQMEMAPMPNTQIQSDSQFEGGNGAAPTFVTVDNDVMCCCKPGLCCAKARCCFNGSREFQSRPGVTCDHAGCNNQAYTDCNGDVRYLFCGPRLHAGCGK